MLKGVNTPDRAARKRRAIDPQAGVSGDYLRVHTLADPVRVLDKYRIRYVLFPSQQPLTYVLKTSPDWKVLYSGQISTLLARVGPLSFDERAQGINREG